MNFRVF